jgi:hypothetical protein
MIAAWFDWLHDDTTALPLPHLAPNGRPYCKLVSELLPRLGCHIAEDEVLFDWLFPADRYGSELAGAPVASHLECHVLFANWVEEVDGVLLKSYKRFLNRLGFSCDEHGWVHVGFPARERKRLARVRSGELWDLAALTPLQVRSVARVLRMLRLLGWQGQPTTAPDRLDFWFDLNFQDALRGTWEWKCVGQNFPGLWLEALEDQPAPEPGVQRDNVLPRPRVYKFSERTGR